MVSSLRMPSPGYLHAFGANLDSVSFWNAMLIPVLAAGLPRRLTTGRTQPLWLAACAGPAQATPTPSGERSMRRVWTLPCLPCPLSPQTMPTALLVRP